MPKTPLYKFNDTKLNVASGRTNTATPGPSSEWKPGPSFRDFDTGIKSPSHKPAAQSLSSNASGQGAAADAVDAFRGGINSLRTSAELIGAERSNMEIVLHDFSREYPSEFRRLGNINTEITEFYESLDNFVSQSNTLASLDSGELNKASEIESVRLKVTQAPGVFSSEALAGAAMDFMNEGMQVLQVMGQMYVLDPIMQAVSYGKPGIHVYGDIFKSGLGGITSDVTVNILNVRSGGPIPEGLANAHCADRKGTQKLFAVMQDIVRKHGPHGSDPLMLSDLPGPMGEQYRHTKTYLFSKSYITSSGIVDLPLDLSKLSDQRDLLEIVATHLGIDILDTSTVFGTFNRYIYQPRANKYNEYVKKLQEKLKQIEEISHSYEDLALKEACLDLETAFYQDAVNYADKVQKSSDPAKIFKVSAQKETYKVILSHEKELCGEIKKYHDNFDVNLKGEDYLRAFFHGEPTEKPRPNKLNKKAADEFARQFSDFVDGEVKDQNTYDRYMVALHDKSADYVGEILSGISNYPILI